MIRKIDFGECVFASTLLIPVEVLTLQFVINCVFVRESFKLLKYQMKEHQAL